MSDSGLELSKELDVTAEFHAFCIDILLKLKTKKESDYAHKILAKSL
jgi:hypothetical protein